MRCVCVHTALYDTKAYCVGWVSAPSFYDIKEYCVGWVAKLRCAVCVCIQHCTILKHIVWGGLLSCGALCVCAYSSRAVHSFTTLIVSNSALIASVCACVCEGNLLEIFFGLTVTLSYFFPCLLYI